MLLLQHSHIATGSNGPPSPQPGPEGRAPGGRLELVGGDHLEAAPAAADLEDVVVISRLGGEVPAAVAAVKPLVVGPEVALEGPGVGGGEGHAAGAADGGAAGHRGRGRRTRGGRAGGRGPVPGGSGGSRVLTGGFLLSSLLDRRG